MSEKNLEIILGISSKQEIISKKVGWFALKPKPKSGYRGYARPDEMMKPLVRRPIALREGWEDQDPERLLVKADDLLSALNMPRRKVAPAVFDYWYRLTEHPERTNLVFFRTDGKVELFDSEANSESEAAR